MSALLDARPRLRFNAGVATDGPFADCTNAFLRVRAAHVAVEVKFSSGDRLEALLDEVAALRDEMIDRLEADDGDDGSTGVREPRRPRPGGSAAAVVLAPESTEPAPTSTPPDHP